MTPKRRNRVADSLFSWFSEHHGPGARKLEQIGAGSEYKSKERETAPHVAALTYETNYNGGLICARSIIAVQEGGEVLYPLW